MQIGKTIRRYRKAQNLTQEEMARRLGVTPPAVNKWENGSTCPDIALLPPLARLLGISLDTLLSFQEELTETEVRRMIEAVNTRLNEGAYEEAFCLGRKQVEQFPNSEELAWQTAVVLDAGRLQQQVPDTEQYDKFIRGCYERALESSREELRLQAADSLYYYYLRKEQYQEAEKYLMYFSKRDPQRKQKQAVIYEKTGRERDACKTYEELLFSYFQLVSAALHGLYLAAVRGKDMDMAKAMVEKQKMAARLFEMGEYYEIFCSFELAVQEKDQVLTAELAEQMLSGMEKIRSFAGSPLYAHMEFKKADDGFEKKWKQNLRKSFRDTETYGYMKDNEKWRRLTAE